MGKDRHRGHDRTGLSRVGGWNDGRRAGDVVFVHGLGGGSHSTWMASEAPESFWPAWLAEDQPEARVWALGYAADVSAWKRESMPIADRGTALLEELANEGIGERPIVFVTHSMGGLLAKQVLRHAASFGVRRWEAIAERARGIAFIATPHAGADLASFADFARWVLRTNEQVEDLKAHHARLRELHHWFRQFQADAGLVCRTFCETREVRPGILGLALPKGMVVVDQTSAEPHIPGEVAVPLDEDHISICKPASREATLYKSVRRLVAECLAAPRPEADLPSLDGAWIAEVAKGGTTYRIGLELEVLAGRLFGTVRYPTGEAGIEDGVIEGERISFRTVHTPQFEAQPAEIRFAGTVRADAIELIVQDRSGHARATARRANEPSAER